MYNLIHLSPLNVILVFILGTVEQMQGERFLFISYVTQQYSLKYFNLIFIFFKLQYPVNYESLKTSLFNVLKISQECLQDYFLICIFSY